MKRNLLLSGYFFLIANIFSQTDKIRVEYNFDNNYFPQITEGSDYFTPEDAVAGGSYLQNLILTSDANTSVMKADIVNNNATNFVNTYIKCNLASLQGKGILITKISVTQRANIANTNNLFRIGCTKNGATPNNADINQSTVNIPFTTTFTNSTFQPGFEYANASNGEKLTVQITGRGSSTSTVNWYLDQVVVEGVGYNGAVNFENSIVVSDLPKQQMRFGVDAERLWYWRSGLKNQLAELAVKELKSDYVRVAINCAYEREQGVKNPSAYDQILEMMTAMKTANPDIKFFASPRPLDQAYSDAEELSIFGATDGCPWAPYPGWIMGFSGYGGVFGGGGFSEEKALKYLADYLNFMGSKGFDIDYLDLTNEKQIITPAITKYMYENMQALLNPNVKMPAFVVPSSWSRQQGTDWLKSVNKTANEHLTFEIAATHNTDPAGTPEAFVAEANKLNKEVWNTELHGWTGIELRDEVLNSTYLWEHVRAGFSGIDSWLFFGPFNGKDHTMIWASPSQINKSGKYEMFKKVVNNANRGYYLDTSMPNSNCITASFIKDSIVTIWALNKSMTPLTDVLFLVQNKDIQNKSIEVTKWNALTNRQGSVTQITAVNADNFTYSLDSASLYCFKIVFPTFTSIHENKISNGISVLPNPASTYFSIKTTKRLSAIELFDLTGKIILKYNHESSVYSLSGLSKGMYFVRLFADNESFIKRIIVE